MEVLHSIHENKIPVQLFQYAIDIIRERSNGKKDYSDFKSPANSVSFIPYVDMYVSIINSMDISECIDCIEGIKTGWTYIRNFLPVVFELNPSLLEDKYDEDLVEIIESNISLNIPSETVDDFDKMKDYYKNNK